MAAEWRGIWGCTAEWSWGVPHGHTEELSEVELEQLIIADKGEQQEGDDENKAHEQRLAKIILSSIKKARAIQLNWQISLMILICLWRLVFCLTLQRGVTGTARIQ